MVVITASGMSEPTSDQERATVFGAIGAYTGRFQIVGNKITIEVDVATNPGLVCQHQVRFAQMSDGKLILTTPQSKLRWAGGREGIGHVVWERQQTAN